MTGSTTNEYVNEMIRRPLKNGGCTILYEPLDNLPVEYAAVAIYFEDDEDYDYMFTATATTVSGLRGRTNTRVVENINNLSFDGITGMFVIEWENEPDDHFLQVSYLFDDGNYPQEPMEAANWVKEGF